VKKHEVELRWRLVEIKSNAPCIRVNHNCTQVMGLLRIEKVKVLETSPLVIVKRAMQSVNYLHEIGFIVGGNISEPDEQIDNDWVGCYIYISCCVQDKVDHLTKSTVWLKKPRA
jgi:hypothetical protein